MSKSAALQDAWHPGATAFARSNSMSKDSRRTKKVKPSADRNFFPIQFIHQLNRALEMRAREEETLQTKGAFPDGLCDVLTNFHATVIRLLDQTTNHKKRTPPPTLKNARCLRHELSTFVTSIDNLTQSSHSHSEALEKCMKNLVDDVDHYIIQIEVTYRIVQLRNGRPIKPTRQKNFEGRLAYGNIVTEYQLKSGSSNLPKPAYIMRNLESLGFSVSVKTLNNWKNDFLRGALYNY